MVNSILFVHILIGKIFPYFAEKHATSKKKELMELLRGRIFHIKNN